MRKPALLLVAALITGVTAGCAKFPTGATPITGKRLIITMSVAGEIDPTMHYYVAFDTSGTATPGPLPAVAPPWGNGWGAGNITNYVVFDQFQPQGGYAVYKISRPDLTGPVYDGPPISSVIPLSGTNKLQFTIDLGQLATDAVPVASIDVVNINFITTNLLPLDPNPVAGRFFDGLGTTGNNFISISVKTNQTYTNSQSSIEDAGDVPLPNLDIIDWTVEVQGT